MMCCVECFADKVLRERIESEGSIGHCEYCDAIDVLCVVDSDLDVLFRPLLRLYDIVAFGVNALPGADLFLIGNVLADVIDEDWEIFSDRFPLDRRTDLLDNILNSGLAPDEADDRVPVEDLWTGRERRFTHVGSKDLWEEFVWHIKHERRFVLKTRPDGGIGDVADPKGWIPPLLEELAINLPGSTTVFRARWEGPVKKLFPKEKMGAPPPDMTPGGRANAPGIPVLYAALDHETAVAEVRPWKGARVSVAPCELRKPAALVDLSDIHYLTKGPFAYGDLLHEIDKLDMVRALADELARPISLSDTEIDYVPTQYLTEVVKSLGYDGMLYPSAMGGGNNVVLFDPEIVNILSVNHLVVSDVNYQTRPNN